MARDPLSSHDESDPSCTIRPVSCDRLLGESASSFLSLGCPLIDAELGGGLCVQPGTVTEICGEAGVGKTQLLLGLLLSCQLSATQGGLEGGSLYISTQGRPSLLRLEEMARLKSHCFLHDPLTRVWHTHVSDANELWTLLVDRVPRFLALGLVKLLIIDSVAAVLRGEFSGSDEDKMLLRSEWYFGLSNMLKMYSDSFKVAVIVSNQVSCDPSSGLLKPALGLAWSYCVNQRLVLQFEEGEAEDSAAVDAQVSRVRIRKARRRFIAVAFSPFCKEGALNRWCVITNRGWEGVIG